MSLTRRDFLKSTAAASALSALGAPTRLLAAEAGTKWVKSVCRYCGVGCGLYVGVQGDKVTAVRGDKENHNKGYLCLKGFLLPQIMNAPTRLRHPLIRKDGVLQKATWEEAMSLVASRFKDAAEKHGPESVGFYGSGQALTEETFLANKLFKAGLRSNNVDGNPRLCMASAAVGYTQTFGKDEPMGCYEDMDHAGMFFLVGSNTSEAHPVLFRRIVQRKQANPDVKVVVLDPRRTPTARIADLHLSFEAGMDLAILNAIAHVLVKENKVDPAFIEQHVTFGEGAEAGKKTWAEYVAFLEDYTPEKAAAIAGCKAEDIRTIARWFGEADRPVMSMWTMGLNQRTKGVWANNLVHNLHLITGKIGLPGSTPFSLTGQPNACGGVRDGGGLSHLLPYGRLVANPQHRAEMEKLWKVPAGTIAPKPGLTAMEMFGSLAEGKLKALYVMCTNPGQSLPNVDKYRAGMEREDTFLVVADAYHPTRTTELADVVLPAALWAEKEGVYGCSERRYQLLDKAVEPLGEARTDFDILLDLGRRLGFQELLPYRTPEDAWNEIRGLSAGTAYDFRGMTRERLRKAHGILWPCPTEDHPGTKRRLVRGEDTLVPADHPHRIEFYTRPDGRAVVWMRPHQPAAEQPDAEYPYVLTTGRVIEQWHTMTMTGQCKELEHAAAESLAELHPDDARKLGVEPGGRVKLTSRRGQETFGVKITENSRPGLVFLHMHDPDRMCNRITNDAFDPVSKQPEFKVAAIKMEKA